MCSVFCSKVETGNGLHALVYAYYHHYEEEHHSVGNAIRAHGNVSAVAHELFVYDYDHYARAQVYQKRRQAYRKASGNYSSFKTIGVAPQVDKFVGIGKELELP